MRIIAFVNQKGGVAKTTSTINVGAALALAGQKVLMIDLDPQASLSKSTGFRELGEDDITTYEVIKGAPIRNGIKSRNNYDVLPSDIRMSGADIELMSVPGRDNLLKDALKGVKGYDYVLIDCSPSLNILTLMALTAANSIIIPVAAQYMPLDGMAQLMPTIDVVKKRLNKRLVIGGVLVTMYDNRRSLDRQVLELIKQSFPEETFETYIKSNSKIAEAPTFCKDIFEYDPKGSGALAYESVAKEIMERRI